MCVFVVLLGEGSVWSVVVRNGVPSLCGFSVWVPLPGWCGGCQGVGFGGAGLVCVCSVFLGYGRMGESSSIAGGCVSVMWSGGVGGCAVCVACVSSHVSMLMSGACPSIWHLSVSDKPGAAVVPVWYPMRCSLIVTLGSLSVSLW